MQIIKSEKKKNVACVWLCC